VNLDAVRAALASRLPGRAGNTPGTAVALRDDQPATRIGLTRVAGNITWTGKAATAWYFLPEQQYEWTPLSARQQLLDRVAVQYATLAGREIHLRRTSIPWPVRQWAHTIDRRYGPTVLDRAAWSRDVVATQRRVIADGCTTGMTLLGVSLTGRGADDEQLAAQARQIGADLTVGGLDAEPATEHAIAWAVTRSLTLGLNPPGRVDLLTHPEHVLALSELVDWYKDPYGRVLNVAHRHTTESAYTAVLTVGRMEPLTIPEVHDPWLHAAEAFPGVEISARGRIIADDPQLRRHLLLVRGQQADYEEHQLDQPHELERVAEQARRIADEIATGTPDQACRAQLRIRLAVSGRTVEECLERVAALKRHYRTELRMQLVHARDQAAVARGFCPGERDLPNGYVRYMNMPLLAGALPQANLEVGDGAGDQIGFTNGLGRRPVFFDGNAAPRNGGSGLAVFVGNQGAGKSTLLGMMARSHALRGVTTTVLDPSGPLSRLADIPELRPHTRVINLTGSAPGTLAPFALVPDPRRDAYPAGLGGDREYDTAVKAAKAERRSLVRDVANMLLGPEFTGRENLILALRGALRRVPPAATSTLDDVVAALHTMAHDNGDVDAKTCETLLLDSRDLPHADLFFGQPPAGILAADAPLTVITMAGISLPDMKTDRAHWNADEAIAVALLHAAYRFAVRRCYGGPMEAPKLVALDEAHILNQWESGRSFVVRLSRDSRKWNLAALLATQNPADIVALDITNLISTVFVGRLVDDEQVCADAARLLRLPAGAGFEAQLASLSYTPPAIPGRPTPPPPRFREVVMRDQFGRVGRVAVHIDQLSDDVRRALDTTPGGTR
jgi:hypothetical protein